MKKLYLFKLGDTMPELAVRRGDFENWFLAGLGLPETACQIFDPRTGQEMPALDTVAGFLLTGSHDMVTDRLPWSEQTAAWARLAVEAGLPGLGVCYGHQLLAHACGGLVGDNPRGPQEGTTTIQLSPEGLADRLLGPLGPTFDAQVSHTQSVLRLPPGAVGLAADGWDAHQAYRIGNCAWGVQFHPEMDADISRSYIETETSYLISAGQDPAALLAGVRETPVAARLLARFASLVFDGARIPNHL